MSMIKGCVCFRYREVPWAATKATGRCCRRDRSRHRSGVIRPMSACGSTKRPLPCRRCLMARSPASATPPTPMRAWPRRTTRAAPIAPPCGPGAPGAPATPPPLPASGADVAAFLAGERGRKLSPETLKLRRAAIRYLHRAAGCPVPTDDVCVSETIAGITRDAARTGRTPAQEVAATATILRRLLAPIPRRPAGPARPRHAPGRLRRRAAALGAGGHPLRASGEDRPRHPAHPAADQGRADRVGDASPCPTAIPNSARCTRWTPGRTPPAHRRAGVPAHLAAATTEAAARASPLPRPGSARQAITPADRGADRPGARDGRRFWPAAILAATASNAARSPPAWIAACIRQTQAARPPQELRRARRVSRVRRLCSRAIRSAACCSSPDMRQRAPCQRRHLLAITGQLLHGMGNAQDMASWKRGR